MTDTTIRQRDDDETWLAPARSSKDRFTLTLNVARMIARRETRRMNDEYAHRMYGTPMPGQTDTSARQQFGEDS